MAQFFGSHAFGELAFFDSGVPVAQAALVSGVAQITGVGERSVVTEVELVEGSATIQGSGYVGRKATGALEATESRVVGLAFFIDSSSGEDHVAWGAAPSGPPASGSAQIYGLADRIISAAAVLAADDSAITAEVYRNPSYAAGTLEGSSAEVAGTGSRGQSAAGTLSAYSAYVVGAGSWKPGYSVWEWLYTVEETSLTAAALLAERVSVVEQLVQSSVWGSEDAVALLTSLAASISTLRTADEYLTVADDLRYIAFLSVLEDSVTVTEDLPWGMYRDLTTTTGLTVSDTIAHRQTVAVVASLLAEALTVLASVDSVDSGVTVTDVLEALAEIGQQIIESLQVTDVVAPFLRLAVFGTDSLSLQSAIETVFSLNFTATETLAFVGSLGLGDESSSGFTTWVVHPEIPAATTYNNFTFNSFATIGSRVFAANASGLYELTGDTDAGANIEAAVRTGLMELGATLLKQVTRAYLGYTSDGRLVLKTITTDGGEKTERWYELEETAGAPREARVKFGKGVKARYWQFEVRNADGANFHIDQLQLLPLALSRRVKE